MEIFVVFDRLWFRISAQTYVGRELLRFLGHEVTRQERPLHDRFLLREPGLSYLDHRMYRRQYPLVFEVRHRRLVYLEISDIHPPLPVRQLCFIALVIRLLGRAGVAWIRFEFCTPILIKNFLIDTVVWFQHHTHPFMSDHEVNTPITKLYLYVEFIHFCNCSLHLD